MLSSFLFYIFCFIGRTKKQQWASFLCHSLLLHTYRQLLLRFKPARFCIAQLKLPNDLR